jgi:hypothetical protein
MGLAFQGFYKRDRRTGKVIGLPPQLYMHAQIKIIESVPVGSLSSISLHSPRRSCSLTSSLLDQHFVIPTGTDLLLPRSASSNAMLNDAQARFPQLVAYLVCLGMPVGVVLGVRGGLRPKEGQQQFRCRLAARVAPLSFLGMLPTFTGFSHGVNQKNRVRLQPKCGQSRERRR